MQLSKTLLPLVLAVVAANAHPVGPSDVAPSSESSKIPSQALPTPPAAPAAPSPPVSSSSSSVPAQKTRRAEAPQKPELPVEFPKVVRRDVEEEKPKDAPATPSKPQVPVAAPQAPMLPRDEPDMEDDGSAEEPRSTELEPPAAPTPSLQAPSKLRRHFPHVPAPADAVVPQTHEHDQEGEAQEAKEEEPSKPEMQAPFPISEVIAAKEKVAH